MAKIDGSGNSGLFIDDEISKNGNLRVNFPNSAGCYFYPSKYIGGAAKSSNNDFARFLEMAIGSTNELETVLLVAKNIQFITEDMLKSFENEIVEIRKMITTFIKNLRAEE